MSALALWDQQPGSRRWLAVIPADGWWLRRWVKHADGGMRVMRDRVAAWAVIDDDGICVEALITGDGPYLVPASLAYAHEQRPDGGFLLHDDDMGTCSCRFAIRDVEPEENWCDRCGGQKL